MAKSKAQRLKQWYRRVKSNPDIDLYALLGVELFETDRQVIEDATVERLEVLEKMSNAGVDVEFAKQLMARVTKAKLVLCNLKKKRKYDWELKGGLSSDQPKKKSAPKETTEPQPKDPLEIDKGYSKVASFDADKGSIDRSSSAARLARSNIRKSSKSGNQKRVVFVGLGLLACTAATAAAIVFVNHSLNQSEKALAARDVDPMAHLPANDENAESEKSAESEATERSTSLKPAPPKESQASRGADNAPPESASNDSTQSIEEVLGIGSDQAPAEGTAEAKSTTPDAAETKSEERDSPDAESDSDLGLLLADSMKPGRDNANANNKQTQAKRNTNNAPVSAVNAPKFPFKEFKKHFRLPPTSNQNPVKIDNLVISKRFLMGLELIFDKGWARNKVDFGMKRDPNDKQKWIVSTQSRTGNEKPVAQFWKDDSSFRFRWLPGAKDEEDANYLQNAALRMSTPDGQEGFLNLRTPVKIENFKFSKDETSVETKVEIPWLPSSKMLRVEVSGFEDDQIPSHCLPEIASREPARMYFVRQEKDAYIWMEIRATGKAHGMELEAKMMMMSAPGSPPQPFEYATLENSKNATNQKLDQLRGNAKREKDQKKKNQLNNQIKNTAKLAGILTEYSMVMEKLPGRSIPLKISLVSGSKEVVVANSGGK